MAAVSHMGPGLLGRAADDFAGASAAMDALMYGNTGAKAAIEIALHDLVARAGAQPHGGAGGHRLDR
jgi:L-alanine-DL-glutamate epimerase-like enolase superfamily enzyme